jgi:FtsP/CotA-like multicopper oxidase with cupredoxin domain
LGFGVAVTSFVLPVRGRAASRSPGPIVLRAHTGSASLQGDGKPPIPIWSYDSGAPLPLRVKRGEELFVRLVNDLPEPTAVHWHGVRVPNEMDGVSQLTQAPIPSGTSFDYRFRPPDAGTFWYHPAGALAEQSIHGLRGVLIVDEAEPVAVDRDALLVLEDWPGAAGTPEGLLTANRAPGIEIPVCANERLRLRFANLTTGRPLTLRIDGHATWVMAIDGEPSEPFLARTGSVNLGPGNRVDVFIDAALAPGTRAPVTVVDGHNEVALAHLVYQGEPPRPLLPDDPKSLPSNPLPERLEFRGALRANVPLDAPAQPAPPLPERPALFNVPRGRVVMLALSNQTQVRQTVHVHGHHFRLLDRLDDGWKPFWLDTIMVDAGRTDRIAFLADNPGQWLIAWQALAPSSGRNTTWFNATWFKVA